jgi:hypothetical protein
MVRYLKSLPVSLVIMSDEGPAGLPDRAYLTRLLQLEPGLFTPVLTVPFGAGRQGSTIRVFSITGKPSAPFAPEKLPQDMPLWQGL